MFGLVLERGHLLAGEKGGLHVGRAVVEVSECIEGEDGLYTTYDHEPYTVVSVVLGRRLWYIRRARD